MAQNICEFMNVENNTNNLNNNIVPSTPSTRGTKRKNTHSANTVVQVKPNMGKRKNNKTEPPKKRIKTSYFDDTESYFDDPDPDNKIIILVTSKTENNNDNDSTDITIFDDLNKMFDKIENEIDKKNNVSKNDLPPAIKPITIKPIVTKKQKTNNKTNVPLVPSFPPFPPLINPTTILFIPPLPILPTQINNCNNGDNKTANPLPPAKIPKPIICKNPLCNHKTLLEDPTPATLLTIEEIKTIDDLIVIGKAFHCKKQTVYRGLNLRLMNNLVVPLTEMNDMIGLSSVKKHMIDQILFFLQGFNTVEKCNKCQDCSYNLPCIQSNTEMVHTVITGPPGVGKTCLARIIGKVYQAMGILSNGKFHEVARTDFVAGYLGQTAIKTQKLIDKCMGGVMFIDEAYSLGNKEKRDSFAKEALDILNKNLSDKRDFLCIIAGYEKDLDECFFSFNDGLRRRFTFRYNAVEYDYNELLDIFKLKVKLANWTIDLNSNAKSEEEKNKYTDDDIVSLFRNNMGKFPYQGGDVETLFLQAKICHGRRLPLVKKCLSFGDIKNGFEQFTNNRKYKKPKSSDSEEERPNMYNLK
jgi:hypothetical protein